MYRILIVPTYRDTLHTKYKTLLFIIVIRIIYTVPRQQQPFILNRDDLIGFNSIN